MSAILPAPRPATGRPAVLGIDGPDLSDLTEDDLASVVDAANAAATDALLRIRERKEQDAGEQRAALPFAASAVPLWPAPVALGPERFGDRLQLRALIVAMTVTGLGCWAAAGVWLVS